MGVGRSSTLAETLKHLIDHGVPLEEILPTLTSNVADLLKLSAKGRLGKGKDADLVVLDDQHHIYNVMACGRWHVRNAEAEVFGTYEKG